MICTRTDGQFVEAMMRLTGRQPQGTLFVAEGESTDGFKSAGFNCTDFD